MNKLKIIFALVYLWPLFAICQAVKKNASDNKTKIKLDKVVHESVLEYMLDSNKVGVSVGIFYQNHSFAYNYGSTQKEIKKLPKSNTIYEIGSITKTFTGTLLAQAVNDGKVKIDDDIRLYFDESYPNLEFQGQSIKLFHLTNHTSGLPFFMPQNPDLFQNPNFDTLPFQITEIQNKYTKQDFFKDLHLVKLDTIPGHNWQEKIVDKNIKKLWQSGGTFGFASYCVLYREQNLGIILLSNESDGNSQGGLENAANKIFEILKKQ